MAVDGVQPVVALRSKLGELEALNTLDTNPRVQPLLSLELGEDQSPDRLLRRLVNTAHHLQGHECVLMLDADHLPASARFPRGGSDFLGTLYDLLEDAVDLLRPEPVKFVPVLAAGGPTDQIDRIWRLGEEIGGGCGLRLHLATEADQQVAELLSRARVDPAKLDLVIDLGYVKSAPEALVNQVLRLLTTLDELATFRSRTVLSGSVPRFLDQAHAWEQPRYEEIVWRAVTRAGPSDVRFGDYGIGHPVHQPVNFSSVHMNVKYSCPEHWLFVRERIPDPKAVDAQARTAGVVCRGLVDSGSFAGSEYSWGDRLIARAADGAVEGLGARSKLVAAGTSHHLSYLADWPA